MPKRSCPFSESFSSQYKIHVGQKELNLHGVFGNKYRQEVYDVKWLVGQLITLNGSTEKTKNLLFNGTKAVMERIWKVDAEGKCSDVEVSNPGDSPQPSNNQMLLRGQTLIGLDGKLKKTKSVPDAGTAPAVCGVCQRASGVRKPCSQCERPTCPTCTQQCSSCSSHCCSICTVTDYTDRYDRVLCCSCSS